MKNPDKTKEQLLKEIDLLKDKIAELKKSETEQKKSEEALQSSEEKLKILFECAPDAYYLSDLKGNFIDANKAAQDMLGYKKEEMAGKNLLKLNLLSSKQIFSPKCCAWPWRFAHIQDSIRNPHRSEPHVPFVLA